LTDPFPNPCDLVVSSLAVVGVRLKIPQLLPNDHGSTFILSLLGLLVYAYLSTSSFKASVVSSAQHYTEVINHISVVNQKINRATRRKMMVEPTT